MIYKTITIVSRVTGKTEKATSIGCDTCQSLEFLCYIVEGHLHLQCLKCGTTHCQDPKCSGVSEMEIQGN